MKSYEETIASVFAKGDAILESKRIRARRIKRISCTVTGLCAAAVVGFGITYNHIGTNIDVIPSDTDTIITENSTVPQITTQYTSYKDEESHTSSSHTTAAHSAAAITRTTGSFQTETVTNTPTQTVSTGTTVSADRLESYEEVNVVMRKFLAVLAATSTMANPIIANSSPITRFDPQEDYTYSHLLNYDKIESGELSTDLNGDGKFDILDVHYSYETMHPERETIFNYYLRNNGIVPEDYNINNFKDENGKITESTWWFFGWMATFYEPNMKYDFTVKYDQEHNVDLDFNADGVVDVKDCLDYWMFNEYMAGYSCWYLNDEYADELRENFGVEPDNFGWGVLHRLDSILGRESEDIGMCIPADKYWLDIPMNETTLRNCARYYDEHWYIGINNSMGAIIVTKEFINNCDFSEEWLDPEYCAEYLYSNASPEYLKDLRFREAVVSITGIDESFTDERGFFFDWAGYEYCYMGEARVDAIEAGLVKYEDYCDILSWHSNNPNYMSATYPEYENGIQEGKVSMPDMNADGTLDDLDMEILAACYRVITIKEYSTEEIVDTVKRWYDPYMFSRANNGRNNENLDRPDWNPDGDAIASLDCNDNGLICDDYDVLFAGIYISKYGNVDFDLYDEFFASEEYEHYENRNWKYYDRHSHIISGLSGGGVYYDYIIALADLMFDMDKANGNEPKAPSGAPHRTGDATADGELMINDAVIIMQTLCNPNKYALSIRGEFNADVNNTNDGITLNDALTVQKKLLNC
ncbi:hypothetical protein [Ruminococcus sp.]|uniref:hypothetical protein n=1 Tax=Ruminococcus sp. TaxID=41978 RepID=UPI0025D8780C|nr:hypothetical protein [Ruminococcus sp.]